MSALVRLSRRCSSLTKTQLMIEFDLERFASTGALGPFDSTSSRSEIQQHLGAADTNTYPDLVSYGPVSFDLVRGNDAPCRIQITFPDPAHEIPDNPKWNGWSPPTWLDHWPGKRFHWILGRFIPGLSLTAANQSLVDFDEAILSSATNGLRILHNKKSNVDLLFERDLRTRELTLAHMVAHPKMVTG